jgi:hypothetical protein
MVGTSRILTTSNSVTSAEVYLRALALSFPYPNLGFAEEPMMTAGLGGIMGSMGGIQTSIILKR